MGIIKKKLTFGIMSCFWKYYFVFWINQILRNKRSRKPTYIKASPICFVSTFNSLSRLHYCKQNVENKWNFNLVLFSIFSFQCHLKYSKKFPYPSCTLFEMPAPPPQCPSRKKKITRKKLLVVVPWTFFLKNNLSLPTFLVVTHYAYLTLNRS